MQAVKLSSVLPLAVSLSDRWLWRLVLWFGTGSEDHVQVICFLPPAHPAKVTPLYPPVPPFKIYRREAGDKMPVQPQGAGGRGGQVQRGLNVGQSRPRWSVGNWDKKSLWSFAHVLRRDHVNRARNARERFVYSITTITWQTHFLRNSQGA